MRFCNDTNPFEQVIGSDLPFAYPQGGQRRPAPGLEQFMQDLKKKSKINRLRYREFFIDFDPLRHGVVKKNKFTNVVTQIMNVPLEAETLSWLEQYYEDPADPTRVNYDRFLADVDIVFTQYELEKDPLVKPPVYDYSRTGFHPVPEQGSFEALMTRLGEVVFKRRLLLKPFFQDKDKTKSGKISFTRMRSILDYNRIPLTEEQYQLLCKRFSYEGIEFNYAEFIELLKQYEKDPFR